jgi:putative membrane protein
MKKITLFIITAVIITSCNQRTRSEDETQIVVGEESEFTTEEVEDLIVMVMINNRLKTALALLANEKDVNPRIESFSEMIVENHDQFQMDMVRIARAYEIEPPSGLTPPAHETFERVSRLEKNEFEREFLSFIIDVHEDNLAHFDRLMLKSGHPIERRILSNVRETLQHHLDVAQNLQDEVIAAP